MKKVLVTDDVHELLIEGFEKAGYTCDYLPEITNEEVLKIIDKYDGLIINSKIMVNAEMLDQAVRLRFVGRLGSGMEIVDRVYAAKKEILVCNSPEGNRNAVAEHALGMLLALANHLPRADREVRQRIWHREKNRGFEISGKTIGIIGFGHTGSQFARKLAGMDVRVLAYDKYKSDYTAGLSYVAESDLDTLKREADIISFHLPLTEETHHLVNRAWLGFCKKNVIIINTSRGKVIETLSLIEGLESGWIGGACLDVFENEKPATFSKEEIELYERLYVMEKVVLSPHIAGWTQESKRQLSEILLEKILGGEG